jgi:hypothetical protein
MTSPQTSRFLEQAGLLLCALSDSAVYNNLVDLAVHESGHESAQKNPLLPEQQKVF